MSERKVIKARKQAIRRARLKKAGTVTAMLPLVVSKGAPAAILVRGRHNEATPGIEQLVEVPEQEMADVVLPEAVAEEMLEEKQEEDKELEKQEARETPPAFEAPQTFTAPSFSEGGLAHFETSEAYVGIAPLNMPWNDWNNRENWPLGTIYSVQWIDKDAVRIEFSREFPVVDKPGHTFNLGVGQFAGIEFKIGMGSELSETMRAGDYTHGGGDRSFITLRGVNPEIYGEISVYGRNTGKGEESIRIIGGVLRPNPFFPIVFTKEDIRLGRVYDKFVSDPLQADVEQWPHLDLERLGFSGTFDFKDKIADIVFASTAVAEPTQINYGVVDWESIAKELELELTRQIRLVDEEYEVNIQALQDAFTGTGLFEQARVRENIPVALRNIQINRGQVPTRSFDGTRTVRAIDQHISLDFEIQMARPNESYQVEQLEIQLPLELLRYDRAGLFASFVHIEGHNHFEGVHDVVRKAVAELPQKLSEDLIRELTQSLLTQSAVNNINGRTNGLYDGMIVLADEGFTPTIIGNLQSVPSKIFDNSTTVINGQAQYEIVFAIMGNNPAGTGTLRFATAILVISQQDLRFVATHVGTHKIVVQPNAVKNLSFISRPTDALSEADLQLLLTQYGGQIERKIQTLAAKGGLFADADITPKVLSWTPGRVEDKVYDGSTAVSGIVAPRLEGFVDGDKNIIEVNFGDLDERLRFSNSLPGTWAIEGLDFQEHMLNRQDHAGGNLFNYEITSQPQFELARIRPLILDVTDFERLTFTPGQISRPYNATNVFDYKSLAPIDVAIEGLENAANRYRFVFYDSFDELYFEDRHVTDGFVPIHVVSDFGLQRLGVSIPEETPVQLSPDLRDYLRNQLFYGEITPRQVYWGFGQVANKDYDGDKVAEITRYPQLFPRYPTSSGDFGIHEEDKKGAEAVILQRDTANFQDENVAFNNYNEVIAQPVYAVGDWLIGGGSYSRNYELVARPLERVEGIGFDMPNTLLGQSAFGMPNFFVANRLVPAFYNATIRPLEVYFAGGYLQDNPRSYTGQRIEPEIADFVLPTLKLVNTDKQDLLDQELDNGRVTVVTGGFAHQNNRNVGTATSVLEGWELGGTNPSNYHLLLPNVIEWNIIAQQISSWKEITGAQAGHAAKRFDDTIEFLEDHIIELPSLGTVVNAEGNTVPNFLDIEDWELTFNSPDVNVNDESNSLNIENPEVVREQLNTLIGPNQVLADTFDFNSLFGAEIVPRILRWEQGLIPSRRYDGGVDIEGNIILPSLLASGAGHEILSNHVSYHYDSNLLENLPFPDASPGMYEFDWYQAINFTLVFAEDRHKTNYLVPEMPLARASIFPANVVKEDVTFNFKAESREYDGLVEILDNSFVAEIALEGDYTVGLSYRVDGLSFMDYHAGTNELDFDQIVFLDDKKAGLFDSEDIEALLTELEQTIQDFRQAEITPRRIAWSIGQVDDKEWDDTYAVHRIHTLPRLMRPRDPRNVGRRTELPELTMLERAIVARDLEKISVAEDQGWAEFTAKEVGNAIPVESDGKWRLVTEDAVNHPLKNYQFVNGEQPDFEPANIESVVITDVQPMPENPADMKANVLYIKSGYVERQYNGNRQINLADDMRVQPEFALRNKQEQLIELSLDNIVGLNVLFQDENVAYDNGNVTDKVVITSISGLNLASVQLSSQELRQIEDLLFTGRITPWELKESDITDSVIALTGDRTIRQVYNGETSWIVPEEPDPNNIGESIKHFPELGINILSTDIVIPIRFDTNYEITFADRHAGDNKQVTIKGFYLDSRNVTLHDDFKDWMSKNLLTGHIIPRPIRWTQGQVERRHYDGTEVAVITAMPELPIMEIDLKEDGVSVQKGEARFDEMNVRFDEAGNVVAQPVHATEEWSLSGRYSSNYQLLPPLSVRETILPTRQVFQTSDTERVQRVNPLFESQIIDPIRLSFNGRKIGERVFNYDYYFTPEEKSYEYGLAAGFDKPEKWTNIDTGQPMNVIGNYYLTIVFVEQMSRLANGQPHVAEDELVFVDAQGNIIRRADVQVELRDEQGNVNRNYEYVFDDNVETIGRITKAQGFPVTQPQAARVEETEIELFHSQIMLHQGFLEDLPFIFEPFAFKESATELADLGLLFASSNAFDPGPYLIEYAVSRSENPEELRSDAWQQSTLFTGLLPGTEYFLFARQADHHNRYEGEIIAGATVVTLGQAIDEPDNGGGADNGGTGEQNGGTETNGQDKGSHPELPQDNVDKVVDDELTRTTDVADSVDIQAIRAELPSTGDMIGISLGIAGLAALASAVILRKKNKD